MTSSSVKECSQRQFGVPEDESKKKRAPKYPELDSIHYLADERVSSSSLSLLSGHYGSVQRYLRRKRREVAVSASALETPQLEVQMRSSKITCPRFRLFPYCSKEWHRQTDKDDYAENYVQFLISV
jgi:hypothetical protein